MATQWLFVFLGGRFDGYQHVADPRQIGPFDPPPEELHLWEEAKVIRIREEEDQVTDNTAERYCLRSIKRPGLEATYEHESVLPQPREETLREELEQAVPAAA